MARGLNSSTSQVVAARNETLIEYPGRLARNAECVDDAWLIEIDVDDDAELVRAELAALEDFPERAPSNRRGVVGVARGRDGAGRGGGAVDGVC